MRSHKNNLLNFGLITLFAMVSALVQADSFKEDVDYKVYPQPAKVDDPNKIEVREYFSFACPHCFSLESSTRDWKTKLGDDVNFVMTPVVFRPNWEPLASAYYIADALGKLDTIQPKLFHAIHVENKNLYSEDALAEFFTQFEVPEDKFRKLYSSFSIRVKVKQAKALAQSSRITGVPTMVVNGKYQVSIQQGKGFSHLLNTVDYLIEKERGS